jgi:hypothetical protein
MIDLCVLRPPKFHHYSSPKCCLKCSKCSSRSSPTCRCWLCVLSEQLGRTQSKSAKADNIRIQGYREGQVTRLFNSLESKGRLRYYSCSNWDQNPTTSSCRDSVLALRFYFWKICVDVVNALEVLNHMVSIVRIFFYSTEPARETFWGIHAHTKQLLWC